MSMGKAIIFGEKGMVFNIIQFLQFSLFAIWGDNGKRRLFWRNTHQPGSTPHRCSRQAVYRQHQKHNTQESQTSPGTNKLSFLKFWIFFVVSKSWFYPKQIESEQHDSLVGEVETGAQNKEEGEIHTQMTWDGFACDFGWETIRLQCFIGWSITSISMN